ncbi:MAG: hypothetical protein R3C99_06200 [Pirellulaceae bacterium]
MSSLSTPEEFAADDELVGRRDEFSHLYESFAPMGAAAEFFVIDDRR